MWETKFIALLLILLNCDIKSLKAKPQNADEVHGEHNASAQHFIFINNKYYRPCENGYLDETDTCVPYTEPQCPPKYILVNGLCYLESQLPNNLCPTGYFLSNNLCYPIAPLPCPAETTPAAVTLEPEYPQEPVTEQETEQESTTEPTTTTRATETTLEPVATTTFPTTIFPNTTTSTTTSPTTTSPTTSLPIIPAPTTTSPTTSFPHTPAPIITELPPVTTEPQTTTQLRTTTTPSPEIPTQPYEPDPLPVVTPPPPALTRCPPATIFMNEQCRKLICLQGEYYKGRCLLPACPEGTVWHGHRCQEPNYVNTIIEIENVFINEAQNRPGQIRIIPTNATNVEDHTTQAGFTTSTTGPIEVATSTSTVKYSTTTAKDAHKEAEEDCCSIITPRICKHYGKKWVCFNRRYRRCDSKICTHELIYLKVHKIIYEPPILIMPPNPPFEACRTPNCDAANTVDCSGCVHNRRETCSPYCYRYMCPNGACRFMDLQTYCNDYPGEFGCTKQDGCIWDWCGEVCT